MKDRPLISIILPAYNAADFIGKTLESVINQTYSNWELIIADDCSQDDTKRVLEEFANKDKRIVFFQNEKNVGPSKSRNNALEKASGSFIAFLDSDDIWLESKLEQQLLFMRENNIHFCFTNYRRFKDLDHPGRLIRVPSREITYNYLLKGNCIYTSTVLIDKEYSGEIRMKDNYYDDYVLWLELLKKGLKCKGLDEDLMRYRVREGSVSRNKLKSAIKVWMLFRDQEKISFFKRIWFFAFWGMHNVIKYRKF